MTNQGALEPESSLGSLSPSSSPAGQKTGSREATGIVNSNYPQAEAALLMP